jgi:ABC-2 type transport system ATP-binding protein
VLHEIEQVCNRIAILNHGQVVAQGGVHELLGASDRIEIHVEPTTQARDVLRALPWVGEVTIEGEALIVGAPLARSAEINRALAEHDVYASIIRPRQESLERYFLELTGGAGTPVEAQ